jgi:hypothetical protein
VWDASVYPAHALYVGEDKKDQNPFREGLFKEWTKDGHIFTQNAFRNFVDEASSPGYTPFDRWGSWRYKQNFNDWLAEGDHPAMSWKDDGTEITADAVKNALPGPLFPPSL